MFISATTVVIKYGFTLQNIAKLQIFNNASGDIKKEFVRGIAA
jgi:hypothetical protein